MLTFDGIMVNEKGARYEMLTKRELQILEILWKYGELTANEIQKKSDGVSIYTIQQVLQRLIKMGHVEVAGIGYTKNSTARKFKASLRQVEYINSFIEKSTRFELSVNFIKENSDMDTLEKLEELIRKKKEELEK